MSQFSHKVSLELRSEVLQHFNEKKEFVIVFLKNMENNAPKSTKFVRKNSCIIDAWNTSYKVAFLPKHSKSFLISNIFFIKAFNITDEESFEIILEINLFDVQSIKISKWLFNYLTKAKFLTSTTLDLIIKLIHGINQDF